MSRICYALLDATARVDANVVYLEVLPRNPRRSPTAMLAIDVTMLDMQPGGTIAAKVSIVRDG